jgi:hypothetical protein
MPLTLSSFHILPIIISTIPILLTTELTKVCLETCTKKYHIIILLKETKRKETKRKETKRKDKITNKENSCHSDGNLDRKDSINSSDIKNKHLVDVLIYFLNLDKISKIIK